jgi:protease-4
MTQPLPPGQGPIDPRTAFTPPPPPSGRPMMQPAMNQPPVPFPSFMPPPPPPRRGVAGWVVLSIVLIVMLIGSVLLNIVLGVGFVASGVGGHEISQNSLVSGSADQQVAVISLTGVITDATRQKFDQLIHDVEETHHLKGVIIDINSPGGEVTPSDEIYERIAKLKRDHPTLAIAASMRGIGASGAYYAACACDHLIAEETTITGSIGVLWPNYNFSGLMQKYGVTDNTIVSNGAPYKDAGSPTRAPNPETDNYLHGLIDSEFARFKSVVKTGRGAKLKPGVDEVANGKAYTAQEAVANGLIDEIGYLDKAIAWVAKTATLTNPNVVRFEEKTTLFDHFPFAKQQGSPKMSLQINGMTVEVEQALLDRLTRPRPMAIYEGR